MELKQKMMDSLKSEIKNASVIELIGLVSSLITIITCIFTLNIFNIFDKLGSTNINTDIIILKTITMLCVIFIWLIFTIPICMCMRDLNSKNQQVPMCICVVVEVVVTWLAILGLKFILKV